MRLARRDFPEGWRMRFAELGRMAEAVEFVPQKTLPGGVAVGYSQDWMTTLPTK
jgi:hypothetical protein